jgi:hypothetical protein
MGTILRFPAPFFVCVEAEIAGDGWMVVGPGREQGWLHGCFHAALSEAREIAAGLGASVRSSAGWSAR